MQIGAPPETIKDTMLLPDSVPQIFILPRKLFNADKGISLAELEFPIYFNFFIKQRKTTVICTKKQGQRLIKVLRESVFGPKDFDVIQDVHVTNNKENTITVRYTIKAPIRYDEYGIFDVHPHEGFTFRVGLPGFLLIVVTLSADTESIFRIGFVLGGLVIFATPPYI